MPVDVNGGASGGRDDEPDEFLRQLDAELELGCIDAAGEARALGNGLIDALLFQLDILAEALNEELDLPLVLLSRPVLWKQTRPTLRVRADLEPFAPATGPLLPGDARARHEPGDRRHAVFDDAGVAPVERDP